MNLKWQNVRSWKKRLGRDGVGGHSWAISHGDSREQATRGCRESSPVCLFAQRVGNNFYSERQWWELLSPHAEYCRCWGPGQN